MKFESGAEKVVFYREKMKNKAKKLRHYTIRAKKIAAKGDHRQDNIKHIKCGAWKKEIHSLNVKEINFIKKLIGCKSGWKPLRNLTSTSSVTSNSDQSEL